jgi:hypothetical protein
MVTYVISLPKPKVKSLLDYCEVLICLGGKTPRFKAYPVDVKKVSTFKFELDDKYAYLYNNRDGKTPFNVLVRYKNAKRSLTQEINVVPMASNAPVM